MNWIVIVAVASAAVSATAAVVLARNVARHRRSDVLCQVPLSTYLRFVLATKLQAFVIHLSGVASEWEHLPPVTRLSPEVVRVMGHNPGRMTLRGTNTYLIGTGSTRLLIDAGDGNDAFISSLQQAVKAEGVTEISDLLLTHSHLDHIGGILRIKEMYPAMRIWKCFPGQELSNAIKVSSSDCQALGVQEVVDGQEFTAQGAHLKAVYTPGHCVDHMCFLFGSYLFSGDCVLGYGSAVFDSLHDLMASLRKLLEYKPTVVYPGHGPVVSDAQSKVQEYLSHRDEREQQILTALDQSIGKTVDRIVQDVYGDLNWLLRIGAKRSVRQHLDKLQVEKRVARTEASMFSNSKYHLII